jgi:nitroimidazol reductase NimA-like FMN-containing flavoprotein (pyridoxamine 5'-phosphate oxidase superfamily)
MDEQGKQKLVQATLAQPVLARLATANPHSLQPHVVPVWFWWDGEAIWISAFNSTRKVKDLQKNLRCAVLVEPKEETPGLRGILFEGQAELIAQPDPRVAQVAAVIYERYVGAEGMQDPEVQSWLADAENTLVYLKPEKIRVF